MVHADLIVHGATILTQDPNQPETEAVAFRNGHVLTAGATGNLRSLQGPETTTLELSADRLVIPGFVDCHTHAARLGEMHWRQDLSNAETKQEAIAHLEAIAERTPNDGWVIGFDWDETQWPSQAPLTPDDLDNVSLHHKILARRVCGHRAVVNETALNTLDLDENTPGVEPDNGHISGRLSEDAAALAWEACAPAYQTCVRGLKEETDRLLSKGITTIADTANAREIRLLTNGAQKGFFKQRSHVYVHEDLIDPIERLSLGPLLGPSCSLLGVKTYTDGSIGARTAATTQPYKDEATDGMLLRNSEDIDKLARRADRLGLQLKAHAIGDRAIEATLDGIDNAELSPESHPRIEHAEMITEAQIERAASLDVTLVMQPNFVGNWQQPEGLYETALGQKRTRAMNPLRSIAESEAPLAFSSDGMPYGPLYGIESALQHPNKRERVSFETALHAYTQGAASALGRENELGILRAGAFGDAVVLSRDPRESTSIEDVSVEATVLDGAVAYRA